MRRVNGATCDSRNGLRRELIRRRDALRELGFAGPPVVLDSAPDVPWGEVVHVLDLCKSLGLPLPHFAAPH